MGEKERIRGKVLEMVRQGHMTLKAASVMLRVSYRQTKRLYASYRQEGDAGLIHGNCGRRSNNRTAETVLERAAEAYRQRYSDFGPTFAAEKLGEVDTDRRERTQAASYCGDWKGRRHTAGSTGTGANGGPVSASWYSLTVAITSGLRNAARPAVL